MTFAWLRSTIEAQTKCTLVLSRFIKSTKAVVRQRNALNVGKLREFLPENIERPFGLETGRYP